MKSSIFGMDTVNVDFVAQIPEDVDLTDLDLFAGGFPHDAFTRLRRIAPVLWHEPTAHTPDGEGFWSVHSHAACMTVVHDPGAFSSETGGTRPYGGTTLNDLPVAGLMLNMMDDPRHQRVRLLVSKGLTPRTIARLEDDLRSRAPGSSTPRSSEGRVRLRQRHRGRAADAGDLHPHGHPRSRSAPALRMDRARVRLQGRARGVRDDRRGLAPRPRCSSTARR